jgi:hypothetical protein
METKENLTLYRRRSLDARTDMNGFTDIYSTLDENGCARCQE